jgi:2',3'-cyclic-nucleotide 2'-phosphodiesterase (5'-nucleotidase family)
MKQIFKLLLSVAFVSAMLFSCQKEDLAPIKPAAGDYLLPLIETTDIHGLIVDNSTDSVHYRLAYIADKVKDIRGHGGAYKKERLLLLDGGDLYQGTTISNLQQGKPIYVSFDKMEYDAVALGNHDFDWGFENMVDPDATLLDYDYNGGHYVNEVPVICANLYQHGNRVSSTKNYVIVERTYFTVCIKEKSPCRSGKDSPIISCSGGLAICQHPITPLQREAMPHL